MADFITITINNWEKFNPRKDVQKSSWLRFEHDYFEDPQFFDFTHTETICWIYILCQASKSSKGNILINPAHLDKIGKIKFRDFNSALEKLKRNGNISFDVTSTSRARNVADTSTCSTRRDETDVTNETGRNACAFDLGLIFEGYPKKEGESKGLKLLKKEIKTQQDFDDCLVAVANYSRHCKTIEAKFIQKFHNWVGEWRDWTKPITGKIKFKKSEPQVTCYEEPVPQELTAEEKERAKKYLKLSPELQQKLEGKTA